MRASSNELIAVIGMAGRFPGARNLDEFWAIISEGRETGAPVNISCCGFESFGITPETAEQIDPQHRLFLACASEAMEDSGHVFDRETCVVGVFGGFSSIASRQPENQAYESANRVSKCLNLGGPSVSIQTGPSSSVVAIGLACRSLQCYESDITLAGGASVHNSLMRSGGRCRPFDPGSSQAVLRHGAGVLVLRRLEDALSQRDHIRAIIRSVAINYDRRRSAPQQQGLDAQAEVIAMAHSLASISPHVVRYLECHASGHRSSDQVELAAVMRAFANSRGNGLCALGSVKANIGDLGEAAGVAGVIKTILAIERRKIPPLVGFRSNPALDRKNGPVYIPGELEAWPEAADLRIAGVNSFVQGGTNAHIVIEEAPAGTARIPDGRPRLIAISNLSPVRLDAEASRLATHLKETVPDLGDVSYTLLAGRAHLEWRHAVVSRGIESISAHWLGGIKSETSRATGLIEPVFLFPGLGTQYRGFASALYRSQPFFRRLVDHCCLFLKETLSISIKDELVAPAERNSLQVDGLDLSGMIASASASDFDEPVTAQLTLFVVEFALAQLLLDWGIRPSAMIGYSVGEFVAATVANVFSIEDALKIVGARSLLANSMPAGAMVAAPIELAEAETYTSDRIFLAGVHGPRICVFGGSLEAIAELEREFSSREIVSRRLKSTRPFHTGLMRPIASKLRDLVNSVHRQPPSIPYLSNVTGQWIRDEEALSADYWSTHLCTPVQFAGAVRNAADAGNRLFVEIGPGRTLSAAAHAHLASAQIEDAVFVPTIPSEYETADVETRILECAGELWKRGVSMDFEHIFREQEVRRVSLPPAIWFSEDALAHDVPTASANTSVTECVSSTDPDSRWVPPLDQSAHSISQVWIAITGNRSPAVDDNFFDVGGDSLMALRLVDQVRRTFGIRVDLRSFLRSPTFGTLIQLVDQRSGETHL